MQGVVEMSVISIRVDKKLKEELEEVARLKNIDKTTFIKQMLPNIILQGRIQAAIEAYQNGMTAESAAASANLDLWTFLDALREKNIVHHPNEESLYLNFLQRPRKKTRPAIEASSAEMVREGRDSR
jgi:antitoxin component of RelBE/YafQ-DinJ toxin-antitoxin module